MAEVDQKTAPDIKTTENKPSAKKKKSGLKLNLIVIVLSQLILAGGGFYMVNKFIKPDPVFDQALQNQTAGKEEDEAAKSSEHVNKQIFLLEDIIVNPAGTRGSRYLSVSVGVEMDAPAAAEGGGGHGGGEAAHSPLDMKKPQLRDALIGILSSKTIVQLTTVEDKELIRQEILATFREILSPEPVYQIYFVDFVLQ
jgi:flagellar FliL protein